MKTRKVCNRHKATIKHLKSGFKMFSYLNHGLKNEPSAIEHYYHSNTGLVQNSDPHCNPNVVSLVSKMTKFFSLEMKSFSIWEN